MSTSAEQVFQYILADFGALLRRTRLAAGIDEEAAAKLFGFTTTAYRSIERGDRVSLTLRDMARCFHAMHSVPTFALSCHINDLEALNRECPASDRKPACGFAVAG